MEGNEKREYLEWNEKMDNALREFYGEYTSSVGKAGVWEYVAERMSQRFGLAITKTQCKGRWNDYAGPNARYRKKFTPEEDELLTNLVRQYGETGWNLIAFYMPGRTPRQCRERWKNYLSKNCDINSRKFTSEEDQLLIQKHDELGPKWEQIAKFFQQRSAERLKNRYNGHLSSQNPNHKSHHTPTQHIPTPAVHVPQDTPVSDLQTNTTNTQEGTWLNSLMTNHQAEHPNAQNQIPNMEDNFGTFDFEDPFWWFE